jgi:hypothetical protein
MVVVIWCDCGEKTVLSSAGSTLERVALHPATPREAVYSWLEDYSLRLEGKEARREYYSQLEEQAVPR